MKKGERAVSCFGKGFSIGISEERTLAKEQGLFDTLCPKFVRDAGEIIEQVVEEC